MGTLWQDVRYGLRMLARSSGFTALVVVILALGIGATTAMLNVIDAAMLRPCTYKDAERLVCVQETGTDVLPRDQRVVRYTAGPATLADFAHWQKQNHVFEQLVGAGIQLDVRVPTPEGNEQTRPLAVSPGFFALVGVRPILGRTFLPEEHRAGSDRVVVLSHTHWHHWFAGDPNVIGKMLVLDQQAYTVVGVLPPDFRWVFQSIACGVWLPMPDAAEPTADASGPQQVIGRLKPGISPAQAQAEMGVIAAQLGQNRPAWRHYEGVTVVPINEKLGRQTLGHDRARILFTALGVTAAVLLLACLHIASLLIARSTERGREIVVRAALGAHRLRLIRQLLTESVLLGGLGGLASLVVSYWALGIVSAVRSQSVPWYLWDRTERLLPWFLDVRMDARSLAYMAGVSLVTCVVFGLLPALSVSKVRLNEALSEGRGQSRAPRCYRLRAGLVVLDIAVAFALLVGAGLMANSFIRVLRIDLQVNTRNVLYAKVLLHNTDNRYLESEAATIAFSRQIMEAVAGLPGVQAVAVASGTPAATNFYLTTVIPEGPTAGEGRVEARWTEASADYFHLLQIPLLRGRPFTGQDSEGAPKVAIASESLARRLWPNENPLGKYLTYLTQDGSTPQPCEIVGVARDVKHLGDSPDAEVYSPCFQRGGLPAPAILVRTDGRTAGLLQTLRREIAKLDPDVRVRECSSLEQQVRDTFSAKQMNALLLLCGFALIAVPLAGIGVYGTIAHAVSRRTHEIGIRMALGARSRDVLRAVLRQGLTLTMIGLALGLGGALAATRIIRSRLYGVTPTDPLTFVCVGLLLAGVALLACYLPARRAARIDPMVALRYE